MFLALMDSALAAGGGEGPPMKEIGVHAINFVLLYTVLFFLARKPIAEILKSRQAEIKKALDDGNAALKAAEDRHSELDVRLTQFSKMVDEMKAQAKTDADNERASLREKTASDIVMLKALTERTIREETRNARAALQRESVDLAVQIAEESLRKQITAADQERLAGEFLVAVSGGPDV